MSDIFNQDSIAAHFKMMKEVGATSITVTVRNKENKALSTVVFVKGQPETDEILDAVKAIEDKWHCKPPIVVSSKPKAKTRKVEEKP